MNLRLHLRYLDPNAGTGGGGGSGEGGGGAGGDGGSGAGSGAGQSGSGNSDSVPRADFEGLKQSYSQLSSKFEGLHKDYESRFAPRREAGSDDSAPTVEPTMDQYPNDEKGIRKFLQDYTKFHATKSVSDFQTKAQKAQAAQAAKAKRQTSLDSHVKRMADAMTRYKDFDAVVNAAPGVLPDGRDGGPDVLGDVLDSDHSADLQYHLSKNPGDYWKLLNAYNQSERTGARFLGALEARFAGEAAQRKQNLRQARGAAMADAGGEFEGGGADDDAKYGAMAREAFGMKKKKE